MNTLDWKALDIQSTRSSWLVNVTNINWRTLRKNRVHDPVWDPIVLKIKTEESWQLGKDAGWNNPEYEEVENQLENLDFACGQFHATPSMAPRYQSLGCTSIRRWHMAIQCNPPQWNPRSKKVCSRWSSTGMDFWYLLLTHVIFYHFNS